MESPRPGPVDVASTSARKYRPRSGRGHAAIRMSVRLLLVVLLLAFVGAAPGVRAETAERYGPGTQL